MASLGVGTDTHFAHAAQPTNNTDNLAAATPTTAAHHKKRGMRAMELGRLEEAIAEFRRAYELEPDPADLANIGRAYRQLGVPQQALFYFRLYLATAPEGTEREAVIAAARDLEPQVAHTPAIAAMPTTTTTAPPPARPVYQRWWFWTAAAGVIAGSAFAFFALRTSAAAEPPTTDLGHARLF